MAKLKHLKKLFKGASMRGVLGGFGSAAVAALGWKVASDVYDAVKRRVQEDEVAPASPDDEERSDERST